MIIFVITSIVCSYFELDFICIIYVFILVFYFLLLLSNLSFNYFSASTLNENEKRRLGK